MKLEDGDPQGGGGRARSHLSAAMAMRRAGGEGEDGQEGRGQGDGSLQRRLPRWSKEGREGKVREGEIARGVGRKD